MGRVRKYCHVWVLPIKLRGERGNKKKMSWINNSFTLRAINVYICRLHQRVTGASALQKVGDGFSNRQGPNCSFLPTLSLINCAFTTLMLPLGESLVGKSSRCLSERRSCICITLMFGKNEVSEAQHSEPYFSQDNYVRVPDVANKGKVHL